MWMFFRSANLWEVLVSVAFLIFLPSDRVYVESHSLVRISYKCIEPDSVSEAESKVPVIMMHAVLDIKETWNGIYENVSASTNRKVCIYDTRNHGDSSWNDTSSIYATVEDLESFMDMVEIPRAVLVGHSLGGQTAMKFALTNPSKVEGIFVEDIGPIVPTGVEELIGYYIRVLERSLSAIPDGADEATAKETVLKYIRRFTGREPFQSYKKHIPLHFSDGVWKWKLNLKSFNEVLQDVSSVYTPMEGRYEGKALFIYGTKSIFRISDQLEDISKLFPNATFVPVETGDHLVHFVYPDYLKVLLDFLK